MGIFIELIPVLASFMVYTIIPLKKSGQTLGKKAFGIRVISTNSSGNISILQAAFREIVLKLVGTLLLGLGFFIALFNKERITLHDMIAKTKVVSYKS